MDRQSKFQQINNAHFDLCIIGAGASGAGCALDAALRGLNVLLIDRGDFSGETSSKSTKLIHGGVRYLEQAFKNLDFAQLRQVKHGLEERHLLLQNAPHLARPLGLVTPVFSWIEGLYFRIGLRLYDLFASKKDNLPESRWLHRKAALQLIPGLAKKVHSVVLYYDGQFDDARFAFALAQSAAEAGATVINYAELVSFQKDSNGQLTGAILCDKAYSNLGEISISANVFLNCTGPFSDHVRLLANTTLAPRIQPSKGVHAVLPTRFLPNNYALLIPKTSDGRVVFVIPFQGQVLLGTTDEAHKDLNEEPLLEGQDIDFLLDTLRPYLDLPIHKSDIKAGFGGIRPLITAAKKQTKGLLRDHEVEKDEISGLFSLLGGKWTTYRIMARDAVNAVCSQLQQKTLPCATENYLLAGAEGYTPEGWQTLISISGLEADICEHLHQNYGTRADKILQLCTENPTLENRLVEGHPFIGAEVVYAARVEMVCTIRDFMTRRIRLEILDWQAARQAAVKVGQLIGEQLGWNEAFIEGEVRKYQNLLDHFIVNSK